MIERFDFYDLYGYLLPGIALVAVLWLPFGVSMNVWPRAEWSSALFIAALAYIAGILLHGLARWAFPEERLHPNGRYPSSFLLDANDRFFRERKRALTDEISVFYGLDVMKGDVDARRNDAFLMCRLVLQAKSVAGYAEHFQGLYGLMRGLTAAALIGAAFDVGWAIAPLVSPSAARVVVFLLAVVLSLLLARAEAAAWSYWWAVVGAVFIGILLGARWHVTSDSTPQLFLIALGLVIVSFRAYVAYEYFTIIFAKTVYRDFFTVRQAHL